MFTGIIQGMATIDAIDDHDGIRTFKLQFPEGFSEGLAIGASVSVDGVCLTVTKLLSADSASFDVILQSLNVTTLDEVAAGARVNIERAAKDGAEIGGHPMSGHIDFSTPIESVATAEGNKLLRIAIPQAFRRYIFPKGYIAINGASLTVSEVNKNEGWFEVWLIPETRRMTVFEEKKAGDHVNIEIERNTQVVVDTMRDAVQESLGKLQPVLEALLAEKGLKLEDFIQAPPQIEAKPK
ncbi:MULTISPECIES: riboflavin synthase subunit alpha [unclassified Beijerinckia]|uniref:riboflavin synthase subunit alpha n=1 Tax=unclassified Beijerinckia TaxID=2638183 RepID=UPI00089C74A8|nr:MULTISPECIES: riboflavin synthase subunit alpha [unclassified Beijerinckia]MDH7795450.1 riboflavin synthase [Beijerinckia sp. GAS462]SEC02087.1 riboflavin synthase alpha chain [Beijerinckia sp. 28-YEA-48]